MFLQVFLTGEVLNREPIHIIGAGPAGLVAAIHLARNGYSVTVYERKYDVGGRFNGDFQGLENWSTRQSVPRFLEELGIEANFRLQPYQSGLVFNPSGESYRLPASRPLFYLLKRGSGNDTLDQGLKEQAIEAGARFEWGQRVERAPAGVKVIVATGPKSTDAIARGMVFRTSHEDCFEVFLDDDIAPKGYAYLLVNEGQATFATCLFEKMNDAHFYYRAAVDRLESQKNIDITDARYFGGYVNFALNRPLVKNRRIYYAGESAGFQDALFGFGIRYAMLSGYLAARSIQENRSYSSLCRQHIIPKMKASLANRWLFAHLKNVGYTAVLDRLAGKEDVLDVMSTQSRLNWIRRMVLPVAGKKFGNSKVYAPCDDENCTCLWCNDRESACAPAECLR